MKNVIILLVAASFVCSISLAASAKEKAAAKSGEELFKTHCAVCHPDGGNIINPKKTLHKADREANNIKKPADIINKMRNPGPGMTKFDTPAIPDNDAKKIAEYIIKKLK